MLTGPPGVGVGVGFTGEVPTVTFTESTTTSLLGFQQSKSTLRVAGAGSVAEPLPPIHGGDDGYGNTWHWVAPEELQTKFAGFPGEILQELRWPLQVMEPEIPGPGGVGVGVGMGVGVVGAGGVGVEMSPQALLQLSKVA